MKIAIHPPTPHRTKQELMSRSLGVLNPFAPLTTNHVGVKKQKKTVSPKHGPVRHESLLTQ